MSSTAAIAILLIYPTTFFFIKDPAALRWASAHRGALVLMPHEVQLPMERKGRNLYFVKYLALALLIYVWARISNFPWETLLPDAENYQQVAKIALAYGATLAIGRLAFLSYFRRVRALLPIHPFTRGHVLTWIAIFVSGSIVEETWRAVTLTASIHAEFNSSLALLATSMAFAFSHILGIPSRTLGLRESVFWELAIGLALGNLFLVSHTVLAPLCVSLFYYAFDLLLIRRRLIS